MSRLSMNRDKVNIIVRFPRKLKIGFSVDPRKLFTKYFTSKNVDIIVYL